MQEISFPYFFSMPEQYLFFHPEVPHKDCPTSLNPQKPPEHYRHFFCIKIVCLPRRRSPKEGTRSYIGKTRVCFSCACMDGVYRCRFLFVLRDRICGFHFYPHTGYWNFYSHTGYRNFYLHTGCWNFLLHICCFRSYPFSLHLIYQSTYLHHDKNNLCLLMDHLFHLLYKNKGCFCIFSSYYFLNNLIPEWFRRPKRNPRHKIPQPDPGSLRVPAPQKPPLPHQLRFSAPRP